MGRLKDYMITQQEEELIRDYYYEEIELCRQPPDVQKLRDGLAEEKQVQKILDEAQDRIIPVFNDEISEEVYLGMGIVKDHPKKVSEFGGKKFASCQIRFYDSDEETTKWVELKYLKGSYEGKECSQKLEVR